jgi:acyl carrier protein
MIQQKFIDLLAETLEITDREILISDEFRTYPEWDSLALLSVIAMIDDEYDVIIEGNDFAKLNTISDLIQAIESAK